MEFEVGDSILNGKYKKCAVYERKFKRGEKIFLAPIQEPERGYATVQAIPIHTKCYWVED